jgi:hypothetical protein
VHIFLLQTYSAKNPGCVMMNIFVVLVNSGGEMQTP